MADNSSILKSGSKIAKNVIAADIMSRLGLLMNDCTAKMTSDLFANTPGMTGNTRTSGAGATYLNDGEMAEIIISGSNDGKNPPLSAKLRQGQIFKAGRQRYDGDVQEADFKADVDTSGNSAQKDNLAFLESQKGDKDFKMVIVGGTEYLGQTQVTDNFGYMQNNVDKFFK